MKTAVLDACVLVPIAICDVLLVLAEEGLYQPHWSEDITGIRINKQQASHAGKTS